MTKIPELSEDFRTVSDMLDELAELLKDLAGMVEVLGERLQCLIENGIASELPCARTCPRTRCAVAAKEGDELDSAREPGPSRTCELVVVLAAGYPSSLDVSSR